MHAEPSETPATERPPLDWAGVLSVHVAGSALLAFLMTVMWGLTGGDEFWPLWIWFGLAVPVALHVAIRRAVTHPDPARRALRVHRHVTVALAGTAVVIWILSGFSGPWLLWVVLGLAVQYVAHDLWHRLIPGLRRERELTERVDVLTRTRRGALDVQAAELRRIERDLHDGAQARLVALSMKLGRAEARLGDQPEVAGLVRDAREEAGAAIAELRDLARGIAPPVLADRGLGAAVEALARRSATPVEVRTELDRRPLPVLEAAAYFVVAEALTNVAKHAGGAAARVTVTLDDERLVAEVADDGPGGADPDGGGLTGLRHRVEALDGRLDVASPAGGGTTIRAELPCVS